MKTIYDTHPDMVHTLGTEELRAHFLADGLFVDGQINLTVTHVERMVLGGAVPQASALTLPENFLDRRELGAVNIGGAGRIVVDGTSYTVGPRECLYIGAGVKSVEFQSADAANAARYYIVSAPAHKSCPTKLITAAEAKPMDRGAPETSNERTIIQYINPDICESAQLLLGLTELKNGSVWNTMPCHLHDARSEVYFYFGLPQDGRVFHFMGKPEETRHLIIANEEAVISPPWSIHMGAGNCSYSFIWAMAGENLDYTDMESVPTSRLR